MDLELDCDDDLLVEIFFFDLFMILLFLSWLLNVDESILFLGSVVMLFLVKFLFCYYRLSLFNLCLFVLSRKEIFIIT